jgi:PAS domain S-box-containing protein
MTLDKNRWLSLFFGFLRILAVVGMYFLTASFGFLLALPPGNVTILWPPSGLSLAAVLAWGWPMGIGVFLGSFLVNLGTMSGPSAPVVAVFIALGSTLQSWLAAWIIRRFVGALPPVTVKGVLRVLGITVVTTLVAPLVGVTALSLAKVADWTNFFGLASAWWLGDYAGICLFTPVLYQLYLRLQKKANPDPIMWLFTSVLVGIALFSFAYLRFSEDESLKHKFNSDTETMANVLQHEIEKDTQALVALRSFIDAADSINHENFVLFTKPFLTGNTRVHALSWLPLVTDAQKTEFEQSIQRQGFPEFHIFERDAEGTNISALPRAEYFPVAYIEPLASNQAAFGFDISSNPARLRTINQARDTGLPSATAPLTLVQETGNQKGILIMMPVYKHGALVNSVETRRSNLIGMANGVFRMDDIVTGALEKISSHDIEFYVFDIDTPAGPELLAFRPAVSGIQELPKVIPNPSELETGLYNTATLDIYGRSWLILARPGPGYLIQAHGATSWVGLLAMLGLAVAFLHFWRHRQKIESRLRASEYDSQLVMNAIPDLMFRISREGVFLDYFLGEQPELYIPPAEFLGRNIQDVMPADVAHMAMRAIESAFITGQAQSFEYALERDGLHYSEVRLVANKNENIVICFIRNITERIYAEKALRNSEQNFRQLAGNIQEVFWMFDMAQNTMVYISPAYEKIWNRTCESLYKNPREYFESILPEDQHIMLASLEKQTQGQKTEMEYRIWLPDGGFRWIWDRSFPVFDETGKLVRTAGLATDITVLKNSQYEMAELNKNLEQRVLERTAQVEGLYETLRASEQLYRSAITAANAVPYSRDYRSESYTFIGEGIEKITGYPPEELTPAIFDGMIKESKMRGDLAYFSQSEAVAQIRVIQSDAINATWHSDFLLQKRSGETCWVQDTSVQILDENGKLVGSIGIMQDITERKMAEDSLRESRDKLSAANAALEKASRMKDEFLASMSHELRTPLTGILGLSEALQLQTYGDLSEKQRKALNTIHTSGRHLLELINDILDLSKIEAGKLEMNLETFSVSEVCQASLQLTRGLAHQKKQDVKFEINPASITLRADPRRLKQMIVNLLIGLLTTRNDLVTLGSQGSTFTTS